MSRPRRPRFRFRAPPPTPVRRRSSTSTALTAGDDSLAKFLSSSARVPDLQLPTSSSSSSFSVPTIPYLLLAEETETILAAVTHVGAFMVSGVVDESEAVKAIEIAGELFQVPEERRRGLQGWIGWKYDEDVVGQEFYWRRRSEDGKMNKEVDRALGIAMQQSFRAFRDELESIALKMENVADSVADILFPSVKKPKNFTQPKKTSSVLCLSQYNPNQLKAHWNEFGEEDPPQSCALGLHLSGRDQDYCLRYREGSAFFRIPSSSILVTIGNQLEEWSGGVFKSAVGEVVFELIDEPHPFVALELLYCPSDLQLEVNMSAKCATKPKIASLHDQLMVFLLALTLYWIWTFNSS